MRDLFVSSHTPTLGSGRAQRSSSIIRALGLRDGVDVLYTVFGADEPSRELAEAEGVSLHPVHSSRGLKRALTYGGAVASGVPRGFARSISPELRREARRLAPAHRRLIADGPDVAAALLPLARSATLVYNAHNIESSLRAGIPGEVGGFDSERRLARFERRLFETAAESWLVSDADLQEASRLAPNATFRYVPNAVDVRSIEPVARTGSQRLVFSGNFAYTPNRIALAYLTEEVMPRVWASAPEAVLSVTGRGAAATAGLDPRVELLGFVDDLDGVYAGVDCAVVPLAQSGGSPLKFVEALAHGVPVVASSTAARGLAVRPGIHYLEADSPEEFAAAVAQVIHEGAPEIAAAGRELAEREYSIERLSELVA
jgi:glycosyltransferase involved in cell wall biosynthesis